MRALVIYSTQEGQTDRVGHEIFDRLNSSDLPCDRFNLSEHVTERIAIDFYDAVIFGSPVYWGQHDARIGRYLDRYRRYLKYVPTAFFSVGLCSARDQTRMRLESNLQMRAFLAQHRFEPDLMATFAGALQYSRYNWLKGRMMNWMGSQSVSVADGRSLAPASDDSGHGVAADIEDTDWDRVDQFADQFAALVADNLSGRTETHRSTLYCR